MYKSYTDPISVKGIVFEKGMVWLRRNERNEWELPGGKLDEGEQSEETVVREMEEKLGYLVRVKEIIQAYLYTINVSCDESRGVIVVSYLCEILERVSGFEFDSEAGKAEFKKFTRQEVNDLKMTQFYKDAIVKAFNDIN